MRSNNRETNALSSSVEVAPPEPDDAFAPSEPPHSIEQAVQRKLLSHPELRFSSLVIRRVDNGVCLEGVLEIESEEEPDVCRLARSVEGVNQVLNHLVIHRHD